MRYVYASILIFMAAVCFGQTTNKGPISPNKGQPTKPAAPPKIGDYKKIIDLAENGIKNMQNDKVYEASYSFKDKKTGKMLKFSELPAFDQKMFKLSVAQKLSSYFGGAIDEWNNHDALLAPDASDGKDDSVPSKTEIAEFGKKLTKLQLAVVTQWEEMANAMFKDHPDKFSKDEKKLYLGIITKLKTQLAETVKSFKNN